MATRRAGKASEGRALAEEWIAANPGAWRLMKEEAGRHAACRRHTSMRLVIETVRYSPAWERRGGEPFTIDNNITSALARLLVEQMPEVGPYIETRRAACDWAFGDRADGKE